MKKYLCLAFFLASGSSYAGFVHPLDFDGSETKKQEVIKYIKDRVKADYCDGQLDMCQPTTLRMMENENLNAFKKLTEAKDRTVLDGVIKDYCKSGLDMCNYSNLEMMYQENVKANGEELTW